jgi:hypothetical protein
MASFKVTILEKDGVEFDYPTEYDLSQAITELGFSNFDENLLLCDQFGDVISDYEGNVLRYIV